MAAPDRGKLPHATLEDSAQTAFIVLTQQAHSRKTYELANPVEPYTLAQLAAEITKQIGKPIPYKDIPKADYAATLKARACRKCSPPLSHRGMLVRQ
ncbi:MAG: hypothetical protein ACR5LD_11345 [Symbiopectobacterium sp.]